MADVNAQQWTRYHGEAFTIDLTGTDNTDPSGYTLKFTLKLSPGGSVVLAITSGFTITGSGPYVIKVPITRAQSGTTLTADRYECDLWNTASGVERRLAGGILNLIPPVNPQS